MAEINPGEGVDAVTRTEPNETGSSTPKVVSYLETAAHGVADAAGDCVVMLGVVPASSTWFIERMSVQNNSVLVSTFALYRDRVSELTRKSATPAGNDDIEDASSPIWFASGSTVLAVWDGCTPGAICYVNSQIRVEG